MIDARSQAMIRHRRITALEIAFILVVLTGICNPAILDVLVGKMPRPDLTPLLGAEDQVRYAAGAGNAGVSLIFWPLAYLCSGALFLRDAMRRSTLGAAAPILLFCMLLLASTLWSDAPKETFMRAVHLTGKTIFAIWLVARLGFRGAMEMLAIAGAIVLLAGWALALGKPTVGWQAYRGETALRGFFTHKTGYGMMAMFVTLIAVGLRMSLRENGARDRLPLVGIAILGAASLAVSQSVTAILMLGTGIVAVLAARHVSAGPSPAHRRLRLGAVATIAAAATVAAWFGHEAVLEVFGRDPTLSRRTDIWSAIVASQQGGTLLGHGYFAFWRYVPGSTLFEIVQRQGFATSSPHNAFLLAWIDAGWVGLLAFCGLCLGALRRSAGLLVRGGAAAGLQIALVPALIVIGTVESNLFTGQEINWALFAMAFTGAGLALGRRMSSASRPQDPAAYDMQPPPLLLLETARVDVRVTPASADIQKRDRRHASA
jgi:exopolysaccharide production protein ExoQ